MTKRRITLALLIIIILSIWLYACGPGTVKGQVTDKHNTGEKYTIKLNDSQTISVTQDVYESIIIGNHYTFNRTGFGPYDKVTVTKIVIN